MGEGITRVALNLQAESPVGFRNGRDADRVTTLPYLPGSVLLGGLASAHRILYPDRSEQFEEFFTRDQVRFGNGYPASFPESALHDELAAVGPLPHTARSCKRRPGFRFQRDPDHDFHGVSDELIAWGLFALSGERAIASLDRVALCPTCGEPVDPFTGFYRRGSAVEQIGRASVGSALLTRTGLSRATGVVHPGILYSREVLSAGTAFWAELNVEDVLYAAFRDFLDEANGEGLLRVGTNRTRGLGRLVVASCRAMNADPAGDVRLMARVTAWNQELARVASDAEIELPAGTYVPLTLISDTLLRDQLLRWRLRLDADALGEVGLPGATLVYHTATVRRVTGWNGLWNLPLDDALAIGMGSVFLARFDALPDPTALTRLQHEGVGERRTEGYGRVVVADSFHWEVRDR